MQQLIFTNEVAGAIDSLTSEYGDPKLIILTDDNTRRLVLPRLSSKSEKINSATVIAMSPGDVNKNLQSLTSIWESLIESEANRHSVMVNLGGGVVTDIGGFAAATFKRGIRFINIPTTLLSAVDAAVGGKTGINVGGLKNEVGAFCEADAVIISTKYFATLPQSEILSGYAEMIKHSLIESQQSLNKLLVTDPTCAQAEDFLPILKESVEVKRRIVAEDPNEHGIRRALNLGHTVGHALESLYLKRGQPVPHGYAVAWGLVTELVLSHLQCGFPSMELSRIASYIETHYGAPDITCTDYPTLIELMRHDKKNKVIGEINFTLLSSAGKINIDQTAPESEIKAALDIFRDLFHI